MEQSPSPSAQPSLADDLVSGMESIAAYYGLPKGRAYYLSARNLLPGVFKIGNQLFLSKSAAQEEISKRARREVA